MVNSLVVAAAVVKSKMKFALVVGSCTLGIVVAHEE
jgi:hypothetical protein